MTRHSNNSRRRGDHAVVAFHERHVRRADAIGHNGEVVRGVRAEERR